MTISRDFKPFQHVCSYCHPNYREKMDKESGLFKFDGGWKNPSNPDENFKKYHEFRDAYLKDKIKTVVFIDPDQFITCCKDHLMEIIALFDHEIVKNES